ncbi:c-type cytochrome [Burkholderia sp. SIMBA_043]|uniref:Cytochrome c4 n=1 Tax=Burkholderia vietnamiensis TaxID=60552 RepID=A0ABS1B4Q4_BURVI|nr:c-type cytochrome [Burkholderia vietnamiensis]AJY07548.1 cytochrome c family protein [Burkholderia vietnamiensis LMG 10929]AVR17547.1 cytochrome c4 [Burkholderia vietnamiensis]KVM54606.1 cytochrome C [Burkholderia vietnamiensis]MBJ9690928.1 cytochrome c4 [Burkholderia vietnamiensis]MBR8087434.1 cytochrome c4 [Burkholderia vietnamiensis]
MRTPPPPEARLFSLRNRWFTVSVGLTVAVAGVSALIGFVWLPSAQTDPQFKGLWNAICSAAGVPQQWLVSQPVVSSTKTSTAVLTPQTFAGTDGLSIGRGATLSLRCTMCHGPQGLSFANSPNLAGQYESVVYKQLKDFQSGARTNAVMTPMATNLSDQDMKDLAAYYASLPRVRVGASAGPAPAIVATGSPMRNIAPCASCHGAAENKLGAPWLEGEPLVYIRQQLLAFAAGERHNDTSEQMRNVARHMTRDEIEAAAKFYSGRP